MYVYICVCEVQVPPTPVEQRISSQSRKVTVTLSLSLARAHPTCLLSSVVSCHPLCLCLHSVHTRAKPMDWVLFLRVGVFLLLSSAAIGVCMRVRVRVCVCVRVRVCASQFATGAPVRHFVLFRFMIIIILFLPRGVFILVWMRLAWLLLVVRASRLCSLTLSSSSSSLARRVFHRRRRHTLGKDEERESRCAHVHVMV